MSKEKPRLVRLTAILTQLKSKRIVTARELAEKHRVSIRTIYRDIRTLEQSGIPIVTEEGKGYCIMEGYLLPPILFTQEEANALITAEQLIGKNKDQSLSEEYQNAVIKIKATLRSGQKEKTELLSSRLQIRQNSKNQKTSNFLIQLQSGISDCRLANITYCSLDGRESQRNIEPFALYTTHDNWILIAFCRRRNDFRAFRLDRIQILRILPDRFEPHTISIQDYFDECREKWKHTPDIPLAHG